MSILSMSDDNNLQAVRIASFSFSQAVMAGTVVFCVLASVRCAQEDVISNCLGAAVNTVGFIHYTRMYKVFEKGGSVMEIRFSDWAATVPLMVVELHSAMKAPLVTAVPGCIASALMIVLGFASFPFSLSFFKIIMVTASFVCLGVVFTFGGLQMGDHDTEANIIVSVFSVVWVSYGLLFVYGGSDIAYNVLDVFSKCGLALTVAIRSLQ